MAYAQGMGRSSIISISLLLIFDYGLRISTYYWMGFTVLRLITCRYTVLRGNWETIETLLYLVPLLLFLISAPIAVYTTVH